MTSLWHAAQPGAPPRVLYWYRSAPGVRVGRPALDEDAIRTIEEQHPDIDFDWPHILEVRAAAIVEAERRPERGPRGRGGEAGRRSRRTSSAIPSPRPPTAEPTPPLDEEPIQVSGAEGVQEANGDEDGVTPPPAHAPDLLAELVGRDIATRLRARYAEISARIHQLPAEDVTRAALQARAAPLDPDGWSTPDEILRGVRGADELFDALRHELLG